MAVGWQLKMEELRKIKEEVLDCNKCSLGEYRRKNKYFPVIGEGSHSAQIMFVGEAPGLNEAKTGRPFCGAAGKVLDELLQSIEIKREDVYIANLLKDRPPDNRNPKPEEIEVCSIYLDRQIKAINPKVVCTLGNFSTAYILKKYGLEDKAEGISKIRGKIFKTKSFSIIPLYHPAVAVYNANMKEVLKKDFALVKSFLTESLA
jgi:DNA polymerase